MPNNREKKKTTHKEIVRKRKLLLAALIAVVAIVIAIIVCVTTGVFDKKATISTVTVKDNGTIISEEITSLDQDYYSSKDLKSYAKTTIKAYNKKASGNVVKLKNVSVKKQNAYMKTTYKTYKDYAGFTGYEMFAGTLAQAEKAGYDFSGAFVSVKDGVKGDTATSEDILANDKYKVAIIKQNVTVAVPGTVKYVSDECTTVNEDGSVTIAQTDGNEDATALTYIIYK